MNTGDLCRLSCGRIGRYVRNDFGVYLADEPDEFLIDAVAEGDHEAFIQECVRRSHPMPLVEDAHFVSAGMQMYDRSTPSFRFVLESARLSNALNAGYSWCRARAEAKRQIIRALQDRGPNDPCWCGSGKKYKTCHSTVDAGNFGKSTFKP